VNFGPATFALGYAAGALSTLSPCVVPLLPILVAAAVRQHRLGLWALAGGLALSFAAVGIFIATVAASIGIESQALHRVAGALLVAFGAVMAVPALQSGFAAAASRLAGGAQSGLDRLSGRGWRGQLGVGLLLGVVWTPCVGPTLGAASALASQGQQLGAVAALMLVFGLGAATPLLAVGMMSQRLAAARRGNWLKAAEATRRVLGASLVIVGTLIALGLDRPIETWLVDHSPDALTQLTTRF